MTICRAKVRELIDEAVNEGDGCHRDYVGKGINHSQYCEAIEYAIDAVTDKAIALIEREQNDE